MTQQQAKPSRNYVELFKLGIDILSAIFILYLPACYVWARLTELTHPPYPAGLDRPLYFWLAIADGIPCLFGFGWLTCRYGDALTRRFPFLSTKWFPLVLFFCILLFNQIRHNYGALSRLSLRLSFVAWMLLVASPGFAYAAATTDVTLKAGTPFHDCPECPRMIVIPAGQFLMGSTDDEIQRDIQEVPSLERKGIPHVTLGTLDYWAMEQPQHTVNFDHPFALGSSPVTRGEFATFVQETGYTSAHGCTRIAGYKAYRTPDANWQQPGLKQSNQDPVVCVNWDDMTAYIGWLNSKIGASKAANTDWGSIPHYRLPSEAEWEYAARAGTRTARWWGQDIGTNNANCQHCGSHWDRGGGTSPVGSFPANQFGLYDMLGNVLQWTNDCWSERYFSAPVDGQASSAGDCNYRMVRGGDYNSNFWEVRVSSRLAGHPTDADNLTGFRIAKTIH